MKEVWKPVVGYEDWYSVSNKGRVRRETATYGTYPGKILKSSRHKIKGYYSIGLQKNKKRKTFRIHGLVADAFIGKRPKKLTINHKDCEKSNNYASNLEYMTLGENIKHSYENGRISVKGEKSGKSKLTEKNVYEIREIYSKGNSSYRKLAKMFGVVANAIKCVITRKTWKHI